MRKRVILGVVILSVLCACSAFGTVVEVSNISMATGSAPFYQGATGIDVGYFHLDGVSILPDNGILKIEGAAGYGYGIIGTITVTRSDLIGDTSSGGQASGVFGVGGGVTLTINGSLVDLGTNATLASGVDILVANMTSTQWLLEEPTPQDVTGNAYFETIGGALSGAGVDIGGGNSLVIGDFRTDFSFTTGFAGFGVDPDAFGTTSYSGLIANVQIVTIPEPCTLMLLSLGGFAILRSKKK